MREITLNKTTITQDSPAYVIAEIGNNHGGSVETALKMIDRAQEMGANAAKFQKRDNSALYTQAFFDQPYHSENAYGDTYGKHREALEFGFGDYRQIFDHKYARLIDIFATPFDFQSVDFLEVYDPPFYKVASGDFTNYSLIKYIQLTGKPVIVSTGGSTMEDVLRFRDEIPLDNVAILHCVATYPNRAAQMNLPFIGKLMEIFPDNIIGLSSHYPGILMAPLAYSLGARIIETHFTLDKSAKGTDQAFSLPPGGLRKMISYLEEAKAALESNKKTVLEEEKEPIRKMGKSPYVVRTVSAGDIIGHADLELRSPAGEMPAWLIGMIPGQVATTDLRPDMILTPGMFEDV